MCCVDEVVPGQWKIKQHRNEKRENCLFAEHLKCQVFTNTTSSKCGSQIRRQKAVQGGKFSRKFTAMKFSKTNFCTRSSV